MAGHMRSSLALSAMANDISTRWRYGTRLYGAQIHDIRLANAVSQDEALFSRAAITHGRSSCDTALFTLVASSANCRRRL